MDDTQSESEWERRNRLKSRFLVLNVKEKEKDVFRDKTAEKEVLKRTTSGRTCYVAHKLFCYCLL